MLMPGPAAGPAQTHTAHGPMVAPKPGAGAPSPLLLLTATPSSGEDFGISVPWPPTLQGLAAWTPSQGLSLC